MGFLEPGAIGEGLPNRGRSGEDRRPGRPGGDESAEGLASGVV